MRICILTQRDPFYLAENISYLLKTLPAGAEVVAAVLFDVSPFGKKESFIQKAKKTLHIFGFGFFFHYTMRFIANRFNPAKDVEKVLRRAGIPILKLEGSVNTKESLAVIKSYNPDLLVSIAGNQIFKRPLIDLAPKGCLNLHTALLPEYRGLMPSFWVLKNNEEHTGVSVFFVDEGIDSGPILVQKRVKIGDMTQENLIRQTKKMGTDAIAESVSLIMKGGFNLIPNDASKMTYFTFPTKSDVKVFKERGKKFF